MSGNGRGNMRPTSRSPPFLVVGLLIVACILAFNYWSVSSKNKNISKQLETLQFDFRSVSDLHHAMEKRASDLSSQAAEYQGKVSILQNSASEKDGKVTWLTDEVSKLNSQLEELQEVQRQKQQAENEKKSVLVDLEIVRKALEDERNNARKALEDERNKVVVCDKSMCRDVVREMMKVMLDTAGKSAVISAFSPRNPDLLSMVNDLLMAATDPPLLQALDDAQLFPQGSVQQQQAGGGGRQNNLPVQGQELGQNANVGQNPNLNQNQNLVPVPNMPAENPNRIATADTAQENPSLGQSLVFDQNSNMGEKANVVQMQQQADTQGLTVAGGQEGGKYPSQNQPQQDLGTLGQPSQQNPDSNPVLQANAPPQAHEKQDDKAGAQEIVAQNIPQRNVGEEVAMSNNEDDHHHLDGQLQDLNAAPAQEDVGDENDGHPDLPEDEMDRQAAANHEQGEDLGNLDENFHNQLHDLSRNEVNNLERDLDDKVDAEDEERDRALRMEGVDDDEMGVERKEEKDFDEHDVEGPLQ